MGITKFAINLACKLKRLEDYNNYLFVGPHPDDIEIGAGATVAKLVALGKKVTFLICTDGRYGLENAGGVTSDKLIDIRKKEVLEAAKLLGVSNVIFLGLCDGNGYEYKDLITGIANTINQVKPDIIFTCDPDSVNETHADHLNVGKACKELANFANYKEIFANYLTEPVNDGIDVQAIAFFMTVRINKAVRLKKKYINKQKEAIMTHKSQYPKGPALDSLLLYLKLRRIEYTLKRFKNKAEGFRVLDRIRMHCMPE